MTNHRRSTMFRTLAVMVTSAVGLVFTPPTTAAPHATAVGAVAAVAAGRPQTMPALQQWSAGPAATTFTASSRIVVNAGAGTELYADAQTFAGDIESVRGQAPMVVSGARSSAVAGDVYLTVDPAVAATVHNAEGYQLESGGFFAISGTTTAGVFNGTRSLLQLLRQSPTVAGGVAVDWPAYPERGIRIDSIPRTFSSFWWHYLIRELSYAKLDMLQATVFSGYGLTQPELDDIKAFATSHHVELIGTVPLSGHADSLVDAHPELELFDAAGNRPVTGRSLDYSKLNFDPATENVVQRYLDQYVPQSTGDSFHVSGDEFVTYPAWTDAEWQNYPQLLDFAKKKVGSAATARDGYVWYMNWLNQQIKARHKRMRVWNDSLENSPLIHLDPDIEVEFWRQGVRPDSVTPASVSVANKLLNVREDMLYYDMALRTVDPQNVYDNFTPPQFPGATVPDKQTGNVTGAMIAVWLGDQGPQAPLATNQQLLDDLRMPLRALAQKTWASPNPGTYQQYAAIDSAPAPGVLHVWGTAVGRPAYFPDGSGRFLIRSVDDKLLFGERGADSMWRTTKILLGSGVYVAGDPVTQMVNGAPYFVVRTNLNELIYGALTATGWRIGFTPLRNVSGAPALAVDSSGRAVYAARTSDGGLYTGREDSAPQLMSTGISGDPVLIADVNAKLTWFATTTAATVRHGWQDSASGPWDPVTADLVTDVAGRPSVALDISGKLCLFVRTTNGDIVHRWQGTPGGGWQAGSVVLVDGATGDPVVIQDANHTLALFVRQANGNLAHRWQSPPGGAWYPMTYAVMTGVATDPVVVLDSTGRMALFVGAADGALWFRRQTVPAGSWGTAEEVFSGLGTVPAVQVTAGRVDYLAMTPYSYLVHGWQTYNSDGSDHWWRWIVTSS